MIELEHTVADVVLQHSACAEVFKRHRIDFCCRGDMSIADAAAQRKVEPTALLAELEGAIAERRGARAAIDPRTLSTPALTAFITATHHAYLRKALPFIKELALKVARVHGDHNPKLKELAAGVVAIEAALLPHLDVEERRLFPLLCLEDADPGRIRESLAEMHDDHLIVADLLTRIRDAADDFLLPPWACRSYHALFAELEALEADTFTHVHLENHVLMTRFLA